MIRNDVQLVDLSPVLSPARRSLVGAAGGQGGGGGGGGLVSNSVHLKLPCYPPVLSFVSSLHVFFSVPLLLSLFVFFRSAFPSLVL